MNTITIQTTKQNLQDIADIIDIGEAPVKVQDLYFPYGYFKEFPELQAHLDVKTFNKLKHGKVQAIQFREI